MQVRIGEVTMEGYEQISLFGHAGLEIPEEAMPADPREPVTVTWNLWHGCKNYVVLHIVSVMCFKFYVEQVKECPKYKACIPFAPH